MPTCSGSPLRSQLAVEFKHSPAPLPMVVVATEPEWYEGAADDELVRLPLQFLGVAVSFYGLCHMKLPASRAACRCCRREHSYQRQEQPFSRRRSWTDRGRSSSMSITVGRPTAWCWNDRTSNRPTAARGGRLGASRVRASRSVFKPGTGWNGRCS